MSVFVWTLTSVPLTNALAYGTGVGVAVGALMKLATPVDSEASDEAWVESVRSIVEDVWINGQHAALRKTRAEVALLRQDLDVVRELSSTPDLVGSPRPLRFHWGGPASRGLLAGAEGSLLVVGPPGQGKSTVLLQLLEYELQGTERHVPLLIPAFRWSELQPNSFREFVVEILTSAPYSVPRAVATRLLPDIGVFLDGLDELSISDATSCVQALERYLDADLASEQRVCVTTCRAEFFERLGRDMQRIPRIARNAVSLDSIDARRVHRALDEQGTLKKVKDPIAVDQLIEACRTPLWLSLALELTDMSPDVLSSLNADSEPRSSLATLWLDEKKRTLSHRADRTLSWLAQFMAERGLQSFFVESIRPALIGGRLGAMTSGVMAISYALSVTAAFWSAGARGTQLLGALLVGAGMGAGYSRQVDTRAAIQPRLAGIYERLNWLGVLVRFPAFVLLIGASGLGGTEVAAAAAVVALSWGLFDAFLVPIPALDARTGSGLQRTLRNTWLNWIQGFPFAVCAVAIVWVTGDWRYALATAVTISFAGLGSVATFCATRVVLALKGDLPLVLEAVLDELDDARVALRLAGGLRFRHRAVLDVAASLTSHSR